MSLVGVFVDVKDDEKKGDDNERANRDADSYCNSSRIR